MADNTQASGLAPAASAPNLQAGARAPVKKSLVAKLAASVAGHAYMSLALIIVLLILVIGLYVYYHGLFFLGPYASAQRSTKGGAKKKGSSGASDETDTGDAKGDPETERLIDSINRS
jgi:hypothetical protein